MATKILISAVGNPTQYDEVNYSFENEETIKSKSTSVALAKIL